MIIACNKCGYRFDPVSIRACAHPAVNRVYGKYICNYCCRKCKFHTNSALCGAIGCAYKDE